MSEREGRRLALLVGNGNYKDSGISRLEKPAVDVRELAQVLRKPEIGGFDDVKPLIDGDLPEVTKAVARFFRKRRPEDLLLFYYSGHGLRSDNLLYLAMADTEKDLPSATALSSRFLHQEMEASGSRRQVLILDCCNSGLFDRGAKGEEPPSALEFAEGFQGGGTPEEGFGRFVLAAAGLNQPAWEGDSPGPSLFTRFLVRGLSTGEADLDDDGSISVDDIFKYVSEHVRRERPAQVPQRSIKGETSSLHLGYARRDRPRQEAPRPAAASAPRRKFRDNDLKGKNLRKEDLSGCEFVDCNLSGTSLAGCNLAGARFLRVVSPGGPVDFEEAELRGAVFESCELDGAILRNAHAKESRWIHTRLRNAQLNGCCFDRARLEGVDISLAQLHDASFIEATLVDLEFKPVVPIPFFRCVNLARNTSPMLRTVDVRGVAPSDFTEFCLLESRKDRLFASAARLSVPVRVIRLARLALFGATANFGSDPGRWLATFASLLLLSTALHLGLGTAPSFSEAFRTVLETFILRWPEGTAWIAVPQLVLSVLLVSVWLPKPG